MARDNHKEGWGVFDEDGLDVRSVSPTRRAAIVNWLLTKHSHLCRQATTDDQIENLWEHFCGDAQVRPVRIFACS